MATRLQLNASQLVKKHHGSLSRSLCRQSQHAADACGPLLTLTENTHAKNHICERTKHFVEENKGGKGADALLSRLELELEARPDKLDQILSEMEKIEVLKETVKTMLKIEMMSNADIQKSMSNAMPWNDGTHNDGSHAMEVDDVVAQAKMLQRKFEELLSMIENHLSNGRNIDQRYLKMKLAWKYQAKVKTLSNNRLYKLQHSSENILKDLDEVSSDEILTFLKHHNLIGYLNYFELRIFQTFIDDPILDQKMQKYEDTHTKFLKLTNLSILAQAFSENPGLAPQPIVEFPRLSFTMKEMWQTRSLYQWNELINAGNFDWVKGMHLACITCLQEGDLLRIEYCVLPIFNLAIVKDLDQLSILENHGMDSVDLDTVMLSRPSTSKVEKKKKAITKENDFTIAQGQQPEQETPNDSGSTTCLISGLHQSSSGPFDRFQEKIDKKDKEIAEKDKEIARLKARIKELEATIANLNKQVKELQQKMEQVSEKLTVAQDLQKTMEAISKAENDRAKALEQQLKIEKKRAELVESAHEKYMKLVPEVQRQQEQIAKNTAEIAKLKRARNKIPSSTNVVLASINEVKKMIRDQDEEIQKLSIPETTQQVTQVIQQVQVNPGLNTTVTLPNVEDQPPEPIQRRHSEPTAVPSLPPLPGHSITGSRKKSEAGLMIKHNEEELANYLTITQKTPSVETSSNKSKQRK